MANKYKGLQRKAVNERRRQRMCESKRAYPTKDEAFQKGQSSYKCPHCHQWHRSGNTETFIAQLVKK